MTSAEVARLRSIIKPDYQTAPSGTLHSVVIRENQTGAKLRSVEITHLPTDSIVLFPDLGQEGKGCYSRMLDQSAAHAFNKTCDAVIFCTHKGVAYRILCELKSENPRGVCAQFTGTLCFLGYLSTIQREVFAETPPERRTRRVVFNSEKNARHTLDKSFVNPRAAALDDGSVRYVLAQTGQTFGLGKLV
jgi:hypothetical protein